MVAVGQDLVQLHGAHHGAQVGHGELGDGVVEVGHAVGRGGGVHHLDEDDGVHLDPDVVLGDHLLARHVQHLLHHIHPAAHRLDEGHEDGDAGLERSRVSAELLDRVFIALRDDLDGAEEQHQGEDHQHHYDEGYQISHGSAPAPFPSQSIWIHHSRPGHALHMTLVSS